MTGTGVCPNVSLVLTRGLKAPLGCGFIFGVSAQLQYGHRNPQMHIVTHQDLQTPCPRHTLVLHIWPMPTPPSLRTRHRDGPLSPLPADPSSVASHTSSVLESKENCHRRRQRCHLSPKRAKAWGHRCPLVQWRGAKWGPGISKQAEKFRKGNEMGLQTPRSPLGRRSLELDLQRKTEW